MTVTLHSGQLRSSIRNGKRLHGGAKIRVIFVVSFSSTHHLAEIALWWATENKHCLFGRDRRYLVPFHAIEVGKFQTFSTPKPSRAKIRA